MGSDLLSHLRASGFTVRIAGSKLLVAPSAELTDSDRAAIRQHRDALLAALHPATALERPYRLSKAGADAAHDPAWDEAACARFTARVTRMLRLGIDAIDADDLAETLLLRDRALDERHLCLECSHLMKSGRCAAAARGHFTGADRRLEPVPTILMRCEKFAGTLRS